jgi:hypothetical protein
MQYWRSSPQPFEKEQSQKKRRLSYRIELVFGRRDRPFPAALEDVRSNLPARRDGLFTAVI